MVKLVRESVDVNKCIGLLRQLAKYMCRGRVYIFGNQPQLVWCIVHHEHSFFSSVVPIVVFSGGVGAFSGSSARRTRVNDV